MALAFSTKVFSVSAPFHWNSLSYQCRSAELFSSFRRILETELFDIPYINISSWFDCEKSIYVTVNTAKTQLPRCNYTVQFWRDAAGLRDAMLFVSRTVSSRFLRAEWWRACCVRCLVFFFNLRCKVWFSSRSVTGWAQPGHPSVGKWMSTRESRKVNVHTVRCTSSVSVVWQCNLVSAVAEV